MISTLHSCVTFNSVSSSSVQSRLSSQRWRIREVQVPLGAKVSQGKLTVRWVTVFGMYGTTQSDKSASVCLSYDDSADGADVSSYVCQVCRSIMESVWSELHCAKAFWYTGCRDHQEYDSRIEKGRT